MTEGQNDRTGSHYILRPFDGAGIKMPGNFQSFKNLSPLKIGWSFVSINLNPPLLKSAKFR